MHTSFHRGTMSDQTRPGSPLYYQKLGTEMLTVTPQSNVILTEQMLNALLVRLKELCDLVHVMFLLPVVPL